MDISLSFYQPRRAPRRPRSLALGPLLLAALAVGAAGGAASSAWRSKAEPQELAAAPLCSQAILNLSSIALADAITHADAQASRGCRFSAPRGG